MWSGPVANYWLTRAFVQGASCKTREVRSFISCLQPLNVSLYLSRAFQQDRNGGCCFDDDWACPLVLKADDNLECRCLHQKKMPCSWLRRRPFSVITECDSKMGVRLRGSHSLLSKRVITVSVWSCGFIPVVSEIIQLVSNGRIGCLDLTWPQSAVLFNSKPLNLLRLKWDIEKSPDIPEGIEQSLCIVRA